MRKYIYAILMLLTSIGFTACSNDEPMQENANRNTEIFVGKLSDYMSISSRTMENDQVLVFPDDATYQQTVAMLKEMSDAEITEYFNNLGFDGAYLFLNKANEELDAIFDNESLDSEEFSSEIQKFKEKYSGVLKFKNFDVENDVEIDDTPALNFSDEAIEYVGSTNGYVIVDGKVVGATVSRAAEYPQDTSFKNSYEVCINHGKYKSFLAVGRCAIRLAFRVQTYRQKFLHKKYDTRCLHRGYYEMSDGKAFFHVGLNHHGGVYVLPNNASIYDINSYFDLKIVDFHDDYHEDEKLSKDVKNVHMK
ncbi:DUF4848 domain-containing protein [uncultured Duncaniella sp.]|uniref:DUF4848 domain-containing protein n=1 Tax=uncultured Duncaniella sp. TaxID=2768039 RepID=UPI00261EED5C|nr:DUF4848 domain-containing protein [uncultured Duncaniella sp.]